MRAVYSVAAGCRIVVMRPRLRSPVLWLALLAALVWVLCCCLHIGQSGKYSDDFGITMRDLATGNVDWSLHPWARFNYFWRPLHLALLWASGTLLWNHDWAMHLMSALAHGGCAVGLWAWLRRMGIGVPAATGAALLFMTHTLHSEAINWFSTICVSLGAGFMLMTFELARRLGASGSQPSGRWMLGAIPVLSFATACWYESPAAGLAALPLVMLAARPAGESVRAGLRRAIMPTALAGGACVLYAALLVSTAPAWQRGSADRMASPDALPQRWRWLAGEGWNWLFGQRGQDLWIGAWIEGAKAVQSPLVGALAVVVVLAGVMTLIAWRRNSVDRGRTHTAADNREPDTPHRELLGLIGAAVFVLAWLPIAVVKDNSVELRTWYTPLVGLAIVLASVLDWAMARSGSRARVALSAAALLVVLAGCLAHIGWQRVFVRHWDLEQRRMQQLRQAISAPPTGAVFVPLRTFAKSANTGRRFFDLAIEPGLAQSWSSWGFVHFAYQRRDLAATNLSAWSPGAAPLTNFSERGAWSPVHLAGPYEHSALGCLVPWELMIPIGLLPDGQVQFFEQLTIERPLDEDLIVRPALTSSLKSAVDPARVRPIVLLDPDAHWGTMLTGWRLESSSGADAATLKSGFHAGIDRSHYELPVPVGGGKRVSMVVDVPASSTARTALIRWSVRAVPGVQGSSIGLALTSSAMPDAPVSDQASTTPPAWRALRIVIPPSTTPTTLRLSPTEQAGSLPATILVHPGWLLSGAVVQSP
jgi:hypothetical protein